MPCCYSRRGQHHEKEVADLFNWKAWEERYSKGKEVPEINAKHVWRVWEVFGRTEKLVYPHTDVRIGNVFVSKIEQYLLETRDQKKHGNRSVSTVNVNSPPQSVNSIKSFRDLREKCRSIVSIQHHETSTSAYLLNTCSSLLDKLPGARDADDHSSIRHQFHLVQRFGELGIDKDDEQETKQAVIGPRIFGFNGGQLMSIKKLARGANKSSSKPESQAAVSSKYRQMTLMGTIPKDTVIDPIEYQDLDLYVLFEESANTINLPYTESDKQVLMSFIAYMCVFAFHLNKRSKISNLVTLFNSQRTEKYSDREICQLKILFEAFEKTVAEIVGEKAYQKCQSAMVEFLRFIYFKVTGAMLFCNLKSTIETRQKQSQEMSRTNIFSNPEVLKLKDFKSVKEPRQRSRMNSSLAAASSRDLSKDLKKSRRRRRKMRMALDGCCTSTHNIKEPRGGPIMETSSIATYYNEDPKETISRPDNQTSSSTTSTSSSDKTPKKSRISKIRLPFSITTSSKDPKEPRGKFRIQTASSTVDYATSSTKDLEAPRKRVRIQATSSNVDCAASSDKDPKEPNRRIRIQTSSSTIDCAAASSKDLKTPRSRPEIRTSLSEASSYGQRKMSKASSYSLFSRQTSKTSK